MKQKRQNMFWKVAGSSTVCSMSQGLVRGCGVSEVVWAAGRRSGVVVSTVTGYPLGTLAHLIFIPSVSISLAL